MIPIIMITDDKFIMPTCVALTSLVINKKEETIYDIYIVTNNCGENSVKLLKSFEKKDIFVHVLEKSIEKYDSIKQIAHISKACLLKFEISDYVTQYDKAIYLDGDIIVKSDLTDLFNCNLGNNYAAGVKELNNILEDKKNINAGIMVLNCKKIRDEQISKKCIETRISLGDRGSMDQQTFNMVTKRQYEFMPIKFNCMIGKLYRGTPQFDIESINSLYNTNYKDVDSLINDAVIIHYATNDKPWIYTFFPEAKEWYEYYKKSPVYDNSFKLRNVWEFRIHKVINSIKNSGPRALIDIIKNKIERIIPNKKKDDDWE